MSSLVVVVVDENKGFVGISHSPTGIVNSS